MITKIEQFQEQYTNFLNEFTERVKGGNTIFPSVNQATRLDKPMKIYTNNREAYNQKVYVEGDHYALNFPRFNTLQKQYDNDFAWYLDEDTVFFFERPFTNKVVKTLRKLLPNNKVHALKNDIMIDDTKIGPSLTCGTVIDYTKDVNPQNSGVIYCLRWTNINKLHKVFEGNNNHELRKTTGKRMGTLDEFLNITKEEFEELLEKE